MSYSIEGDKRQKLIQWDEETIAEHDRERGSRQKIDEAPTPFRYLSESDHSENECESDGSDSAGLKQRIKDGSHIHFSFNGANGEHYISPPQKSANSVEDSWEAINAKLNYEKHLQDISDGHAQEHEHFLNGGVGGLTAQQSDTAMAVEDHDHIEDENRTEFGELVESEAALNTKLNKRIGYNNSGQNSNRNSNSRTNSLDILAAGVPHTGLTINSSASPRTNVFSKTTANGTGSGSGSDHSILKRHSRFSSSNSPPPPAMQQHHNVGGSTGSHHNSHVAHHHNIHFSNSPLSSPFPGSSSRNPSTDNVHSTGTTQSIFAGLNGSIGGDSSVASHHQRMQLSSSSSGGIAHADSCSGDESQVNVTQFKNKRAGHYNEYKVLQAMRAKMAAEEDSDEADDEPVLPRTNGHSHH